MLNFGNKDFRNMQEQVLLNAEQIQAIKSLQLRGLSLTGHVDGEWGLPLDAAKGDVYLVGYSAPYELYVRTGDIIYERNDDDVQIISDTGFRNLGQYPAPGPVGPEGATGEKGETGSRGSVFHVGSTYPESPAIDDYYLALNGRVYRFNGESWVYALSIRGPQGPQGNKGESIQGPKGDPGPRGERGYAASAVIVKGKLNNIQELPDPDLVERNAAYVIGTNIYGITGEDDNLA